MHNEIERRTSAGRWGRRGRLSVRRLVGAAAVLIFGALPAVVASPTVEAQTVTQVQRLAGGGMHTCALKLDGTVWCWGNNANGELGDGTNTASLTPTRVSGLTGVSSISAKNAHTCALKTDGTVWCWGWNRVWSARKRHECEQLRACPSPGTRRCAASSPPACSTRVRSRRTRRSPAGAAMAAAGWVTATRHTATYRLPCCRCRRLSPSMRGTPTPVRCALTGLCTAGASTSMDNSETGRPPTARHRPPSRD